MAANYGATVFDGNFSHFGEKRSAPARTNWKYVAEYASEFLGTMMFAFFGSFPSAGAAGNGIALAVLVYCTATASGGKLNPVVSLAVASVDTSSSLSASAVRVVLEAAVQILGAAAGVAVAAAIDSGVTCFAPPSGTGQGAVLLAEMFITLLLVLTVLSTAVEEAGKPRFGAVAPLAIGLSLFAGALTAGSLTGGSANPARFLGAAIAGRHCSGRMHYAWSYLLGELLGALVATLLHVAREAVRNQELASKGFVPARRPAAAANSYIRMEGSA